MCISVCVCVCVLVNTLPCLFLSLQLLALTIQQEKPELESEKTRLLQQEEDKKIQLAQLEESLLEVRVHDVRHFTWSISASRGTRGVVDPSTGLLLLLDESGRECVPFCKFGLA